jgi:TonB family protein
MSVGTKMIRDTLRWISEILLFLVLVIFSSATAQAGSKTFAYVSTRYVITAEVDSKHSFMLNFINLSDFVVVIQPNEFIYRGSSGRFYIGQVFDRESKNTRGETQKYSASYLLKGHTFIGLTLVGGFYEQDQIDELSVRIGAKRFMLQPLEGGAFEALATKISRLDLDSASASTAFYEAGISEMGTVKTTDGTSEWDRDWQGLLTADGFNPPKILERPEITLTSESIRSRVYGKVRLSAIITKSGGIQDLKVLKGLDRNLDKRALEGVKNSWVFLPATKNGEVMDQPIFFEVEFPAPVKRQSD